MKWAFLKIHLTFQAQKLFSKRKLPTFYNDRMYGNRIFIVFFAKKINHLI